MQLLRSLFQGCASKNFLCKMGAGRVNLDAIPGGGVGKSVGAERMHMDDIRVTANDVLLFLDGGSCVAFGLSVGWLECLRTPEPVNSLRATPEVDYHDVPATAGLKYGRTRVAVQVKDGFRRCRRAVWASHTERKTETTSCVTARDLFVSAIPVETTGVRPRVRSAHYGGRSDV